MFPPCSMPSVPTIYSLSWRLWDTPLGGVHAIGFQHANSLARREMTAFAIRRTHLKRPDSTQFSGTVAQARSDSRPK